MKNKIEEILALLLKDAVNVVPIFVHNAASQTIAAVILAESAQVLSVFSKPADSAPAAADAPAK